MVHSPVSSGALFSALGGARGGSLLTFGWSSRSAAIGFVSRSRALVNSVLSPLPIFVVTYGIAVQFDV